MTNQETVQETVAQSAGAWDTAKMYAQDAWIRVQESQNILFTIALYSGVGFLIGYFLKKYAHFLAFFVILIVGVSLLQQLDYISMTIHWSKVQELFGMPQGQDIADVSLVNYVLDWTKANFAATISLLVGFLIGLRFG